MTTETPQTIDEIAAEYWEDLLRRDPTTATFYGDHRYRDRLPQAGPEGRAAEGSDLAKVLRRLHDVDPNTLDPSDRVTFEMLRSAAEDGLHGLSLGMEQLGVDQLAGPQIWLAELINWHRLTEPGDVDALIARYDQFPQYLRDYTENLRYGVENGRAAYFEVVERVIGQLEGHLATPVGESPLVPRGKVPDDVAERVERKVESVIYPAYRALLDFLTGDYRPRARVQPGISSVRAGDEVYAYLVRIHTTTDLTPQELHDVGLAELAEIREEVRVIGDRLGLAGGLGAIGKALRERREYVPADRATLLTESERLLALIGETLPATFGVLPKTPCIVKPIEEYREQDAPGAYYYPPAADGSRPGIFYVNTSRPETRPLHTLPALVAHEGVPGHHMQIAIAQETSGLPTFRRLSTGCTAYVEGWALYSERLAGELGLYRTDAERIGMLEAQAWRAVRLVVDTGLHAFGWERNRAIQFFVDEVGTAEAEAAVEIDRYISWPGQALAYKTGQREIQELRRAASARLGAGFDLREFHDEVLRHGSVPLHTLRGIVGRWMERAA